MRASKGTVADRARLRVGQIDGLATDAALGGIAEGPRRYSLMERRSQGDERRRGEAFVAELPDDAEDDDVQRARRSAHLRTAAAELGDDESGNDRRLEPLLGLDARCEGDGERQRNQPDNGTGDAVLREETA